MFLSWKGEGGKGKKDHPPPPPSHTPTNPSTHNPAPKITHTHFQADVRVVLRAEDDAVRCLKRVVHRIIEELDLRPPKAKMWEEKRNKMKNLYVRACVFRGVCGTGGRSVV